MATEQLLKDDYSDVSKCEYESLLKIPLTMMCTYVSDNCKDFNVANLHKLRYCSLGEESTLTTLLFYLILTLMVSISFFYLSRVSSVYLTPALTKISVTLGLSETLSGATILAFANGAPDIIASYAAGKTPGGIYISIGNLFGAGLFGTTLVLGRCIQLSTRKLQMDPSQWNRDLLFYIAACLTVIAYGAYVESINYLMAAGFYALYLVYLVIVICQDKESREERDSVDLINYVDRHEYDRQKIEAKLAHAGLEGLNDSFYGDGEASPRKKLVLTVAEIKNVLNQDEPDVSLAVITNDEFYSDFEKQELTAFHCKKTSYSVIT